MEDKFLPGFKKFGRWPAAEEKTTEFLVSIIKRIIDEDPNGVFILSMKEEERLKRIVAYAKDHEIEIPAEIERRLKARTGALGDEDITKRGAIVLQELYNSTPLWIPVSLETFRQSKNIELLNYTRELGRMSITLEIVKPEPNQVPAAGDLAKRTFYLFIDYAQRKKTGEPGPIRFGDFLERLGLKDADMETRQLIKRYCDAFRYTGLLVQKFNEKGKEVLYDYAPFLKRYTWEKGKGSDSEFGQDAEISPVINEQFEKMIFQDYPQFVFVPRERLRGRPKQLTDRDLLFQDWIRGKRGLSIVKIKIKNLLIEVFQISEKELEYKSLEKIRGLIIRNLNHAQSAGLVGKYQLKAVEKRADYLKGIIRLWPKRSAGGSAGVDPERLESLLDDYCKWAYDPQNRFASTLPEEAARKYLKNFVHARGLDVLDELLNEAIADDPWFEEGGESTSSLIQFWEKIKAKKETPA